MQSQVAQIEDFLEEALKTVNLADQQGVPLRIMGSVAVRLHSQEFIHIHNALNRQLTDIDFMTFSKISRKVNPLLVGLGFAPDERFNAFHGATRQIFYDARHRTVDIFFDKLEMNHTINFVDRLDVDRPTVPLAELLMSKMQVVKINEKDIKDTILLLREHDIGDDDVNKINVGYVAKIMARDWGFYYTFTTNLDKVSVFTDRYENLGEEDRNVVKVKIARIKERVENEPKSMGWKMRAKVGSKSKWYTEVDEVAR